MDIQAPKPLGKQALTVLRAALARSIRVASVAHVALIEFVVHSTRLVEDLRGLRELHWLCVPMQTGVAR